jgi:hypothetical protein
MSCRTSRFRCDDDQDVRDGNGRASSAEDNSLDMIKDACSGIPIKTPF